MDKASIEILLSGDVAQSRDILRKFVEEVKEVISQYVYVLKSLLKLVIIIQPNSMPIFSTFLLFMANGQRFGMLYSNFCDYQRSIRMT